MANATIDFDARDLAARIEQLKPSEVDELPFGVVHLDREGSTAVRLRDGPAREEFFSFGECVGIADLHKRIMGAMESGHVELEFGWSTEKTDSQRDLSIRVQSARRGGVRLFFDRD